MGNKRNQKVRKEMINKYGEKCFIEELHLRDKKDIEKEFRLYGKKQRKIMDELTYHHIVEKCKGGETTEENGAILRNINHRWFNRLSKEKQAEINKLFQAYKENYKRCKIEFVDDLETGIELAFTDLQVYDMKKEKKDKFNRAKEKENSRKNIEKGMLEWEDR